MQLYGIIVAISLLGAILCSAMLSKEKLFTVLSFWGKAVFISFVCARLYFVLINISYYTVEIASPKSMLFFWEGGMSLFGAVFGIILVCIFENKNDFHSFSKFVNAVAISSFVFLFGMRLAEAFAKIGKDETVLGIGKIIDVQNSMFVIHNGLFSQLAIYRLEACFAAMAVIALLLLFFKWQEEPKPYIAYTALALLSASQIVFESLRNDGHMLVGFVHAQQILFAILLVVLLCVLYAKLPKNQRIPVYVFIFVIVVLVGIAFAMEFVVDGRLHLPIANTNPMLRNYCIIGLVSILFFALAVQFVGKLRKLNQ